MCYIFHVKNIINAHTSKKSASFLYRKVDTMIFYYLNNHILQFDKHIILVLRQKGVVTLYH